MALVTDFYLGHWAMQIDLTDVFSPSAMAFQALGDSWDRGHCTSVRLVSSLFAFAHFQSPWRRRNFSYWRDWPLSVTARLADFARCTLAVFVTRKSYSPFSSTSASENFLPFH